MFAGVQGDGRHRLCAEDVRHLHRLRRGGRQLDDRLQAVAQVERHRRREEEAEKVFHSGQHS